MSGGMINLVIHLKSSLFNGEIVANLESRLEAGGEPRVGSRVAGAAAASEHTSSSPSTSSLDKITNSPRLKQN